jgi:hypothetical protein
LDLVRNRFSTRTESVLRSHAHVDLSLRSFQTAADRELVILELTHVVTVDRFRAV